MEAISNKWRPLISPRFDKNKVLNVILYYDKKTNFVCKKEGNTIPDNPTIPFKTLIASSHSFALKNIHATFTKLNVINHANHVHILNPSFVHTL